MQANLYLQPSSGSPTGTGDGLNRQADCACAACGVPSVAARSGPSPEALEQLKRTFTSGDARVEVAQSYTSGNLVVLVLTERQHGIVAGMPEQDCLLRVTLVFRREAGQWRLVHRHADPLVNEITLQRGDPNR
jgi:hypothetical protein